MGVFYPPFPVRSPKQYATTGISTQPLAVRNDDSSKKLLALTWAMQNEYCHCEIRLYRRKAVFEDEITLYNACKPPCSRDRHRTGAWEPICEIGSVQALKKDWWLCRGSAKTPLS